ncbi:MFS general substrate transporter [Venturia nashicola]|uniref:MFS general substrate transporter n=1 Tax=Venturia nashicola TaxID=86259 RepID=A0A4Z1P9V2_9PEZI|nr:MFS general substrate transporter [Venturia nashicola]
MSSSSFTDHESESSSRCFYNLDNSQETIATEDATPFGYNEKSEDIHVENLDSEKCGEGLPHTHVPNGSRAPLGLATTQKSENTGVKATKESTRVSVNNASQIPNGGFQAWMQVVGGFFLFFNTWGIINTFGVYQTIYETSYLRSSSPSSISWIGSLQIFLLMVGGALTGPIYDAGHFRALIAVGSFLIVFGHMMLSLCTSYWQIILAQAFCIGIGSGCLFVPAVAIISTYFNSKLALATGIAASGSSLGGVLYPIILNRLYKPIGFGWSVRIIGFLALVTLLIPIMVMKPRVLPAAKRALIDWTAFKSAPFMIFTLGSFIGFMGLFMFFFYIQLYAIRKHVTNENLAFYLLSMLNAASTFGRIIPNFVADRVGPLNIIVPCALISGILIFTLIPVNNLAGTIIVTLLYGFFSGAFVSLTPTIIVQHLSPNRGLVGTRLGMSFSIIAVGALIGNPIAGAILDVKGFISVWIFGGTLVLLGGVFMAISRVILVGWKPFVKA